MEPVCGHPSAIQLKKKKLIPEEAAWTSHSLTQNLIIRMMHWSKISPEEVLFWSFPHTVTVQQVTRARGAQANDVGPKLPKAKAAEALNSRLLSHIWQAATAQLIKAGTIVLHSGKSRVFKSLQSTYLRQRMNRK